MKEYHKIQTVYHRSPESKFKNLMPGVWALPEFELLKDINWQWTEKVDGTNIRIMWDGETVRFGGKTNEAQIPTFLLNVLQDTFTAEKMRLVFPETDNVCLYGEGFGSKIQKVGSGYIPDGNGFILFDCRVGSWWLSRESIEDIARKLSIAIVPIIGVGPLEQAIELAKNGFKSTISVNRDLVSEGLIMKPVVDLFTRKGERIVAKIKTKDFAGL